MAVTRPAASPRCSRPRHWSSIINFHDNLNRFCFSTRMHINTVHGDAACPAVWRTPSEERRKRISCAGAANDGSRCHCCNGPGAGAAAGQGAGAAAGQGAGAAAGQGAGSALAGARRTAMQQARRRGAPRRKSCGCNCCGFMIALIVVTMRLQWGPQDSERPAAALGGGGAPPGHALPCARQWLLSCGPPCPLNERCSSLKILQALCLSSPPGREMQRASKTVRTNQQAWPGQQIANLI